MLMNLLFPHKLSLHEELYKKCQLILRYCLIIDTSRMRTSAALGVELGTISGLVYLMSALIISYLVKLRFFSRLECTHTLTLECMHCSILIHFWPQQTLMSFKLYIFNSQLVLWAYNVHPANHVWKFLSTATVVLSWTQYDTICPTHGAQPADTVIVCIWVIPDRHALVTGVGINAY